MKKIVITEDQYCHIVKELLSSNEALISESVINEGLIRTLFRGCRSFDDVVNRLLKLIAAGAITAAVGYHYIHKMFPNASTQDMEKVEKMISQVEEKVKEDTYFAGPRYNTQYTMSKNGIDHVKNMEKLYLKGYCATVAEARKGIVTIGYGHVITDKDSRKLQLIKQDFLKYVTANPNDCHGKYYKPSRDLMISENEADQILYGDIKICMNYVRQLCTQANVKFENAGYFNQGLIDAMGDLMMSGYGNFKNSSFYDSLKRCRIKNGQIEEGDFNVTVAALKRSVIRQGKKELPGLINRRAVEYRMAMSDR